MEKRRPTYDLGAFKVVFSNPDRIAATGVAFQGAAALGLVREGIAAVVRTMERRHFYKSMTSVRDHRAWQDVYHVPWSGMVIYVKFTADVITEFRLLSFKER